MSVYDSTETARDLALQKLSWELIDYFLGLYGIEHDCSGGSLNYEKRRFRVGFRWNVRIDPWTYGFYNVDKGIYHSTYQRVDVADIVKLANHFTHKYIDQAEKVMRYVLKSYGDKGDEVRYLLATKHCFDLPPKDDATSLIAELEAQGKRMPKFVGEREKYIA